jgi:hypothetical protein
MLGSIVHLSQVHMNQAYGISQPALISMVIVSALFFAGPATVGLFYLLIRDKRSIQPALPERSEEVPEERHDQAA